MDNKKVHYYRVEGHTVCLTYNDNKLFIKEYSKTIDGLKYRSTSINNVNLNSVDICKNFLMINNTLFPFKVNIHDKGIIAMSAFIDSCINEESLVESDWINTIL